MEEKEVGTVVHFYDKISVAVISATADGFSVGDTLHIKGKTADFEMVVDSMQVDHKATDKARAGETVAIKVTEPVKEGDIVYKK